MRIPFLTLAAFIFLTYDSPAQEFASEVPAGVMGPGEAGTVRGRSTGPGTEDSFRSLSFLEESDNPLLQSMASALSWPEEPLGLSLHARWVPEKPDHGQWYVNLGYQATDSLRVGFDFRPLTDDLSILANWRVFPENETWRPALIVGTSNDDFGPINSQSYYATFSKRLFEFAEINFSPYAGAVYIEALDEVRPVGGLHLRRGAWSALLMYSGVHEHLSISRDFGSHTLTLLLFDLMLPGVAYSFSFGRNSTNIWFPFYQAIRQIGESCSHSCP